MAPKVRVRPKAAAAKKRPAAAGVGRMRRPAAKVSGDSATEALEKWKRGEETILALLDPRTLMESPEIVVTEGSYYQAPCQLAVKFQSMGFEGSRIFLKMKVHGTQNDALLQHVTGHPRLEYRGHLCPEDCSGDQVAEDLIHLRRGRKLLPPDKEEGWARNLEGIEIGAGGEDELEALRRRGALAGSGPEEPPAPKPSPPRDSEKKKAKKKKKEGKEKKKKKKKKKKEEERPRGSGKEKEEPPKRKKEIESVESSSSSLQDDGSNPKACGVKTGQALYRGTGLDPRERIRNRVTRRARRYLKKKGEKVSSSGSSDGSSDSSEDENMEATESLYGEASKVMTLAEVFPGTLCNQAVSQMRMSLVQELGVQENINSIQPVATAYYRQHLSRRAAAPMARELLTLSTILDQLLRNRPAAAADTATQRIKSLEQLINGVHWSVAQKLETLPSDQQTLTPLPEATSAQRQVYNESRMRWAAAHPDGRAPRGVPQLPNKNKGDGKQGQGKDPGRGKGGKNQRDQGGKNDAAKKKE